jgi:hypothetical protein
MNLSDIDDREYYATRASVERSLSETACDPGIALIHAQLADRYDKLASGLNEPGPRLHIAVSADGHVHGQDGQSPNRTKSPST